MTVVGPYQLITNSPIEMIIGLRLKTRADAAWDIESEDQKREVSLTLRGEMLHNSRSISDRITLCHDAMGWGALLRVDCSRDRDVRTNESEWTQE